MPERPGSTRLGDFGFAINATRWAYFTTGSYPGERVFYVRLGLWPGWSRSFGWRRRGR